MISGGPGTVPSLRTVYWSEATAGSPPAKAIFRRA
jgi:hypothetical protein